MNQFPQQMKKWEKQKHTWFDDMIVKERSRTEKNWNDAWNA